MLPPPPELDPAISPDMLSIPFSLGAVGWAVVIAGLLILLALAWLVIRLIRKGRSVIPPTPGQIALGKVRALMSGQPGLREASTGLSLILRAYLAGRSEDPALYETQQEFNRRADALSTLSGALQHEVRDFLQELSAHKYSSQTGSDAEKARHLGGQTAGLIERIDAHLRESIQRPAAAQQAPSRPEKISF